MCVEEAHIVQWSFGTMNLKLPSLQSWARLLTNGLATIFLMNPILPQSSSRFWWWPFVIFVRKRLLPLWPRCHLDVAWVPCKIHIQGTKCRVSQICDTRSFMKSRTDTYIGTNIIFINEANTVHCTINFSSNCVN